MSRRLKKEIYDVINSNMDQLSEVEIAKSLRNIALECELEKDYDTSRKYGKWSDDELRIVFSHPPTKENCVKLAKVFKRGIGSIEEIYRFAAESKKLIKEKGKENDSFIQQVKRIAKQEGWVIG